MQNGIRKGRGLRLATALMVAVSCAVAVAEEPDRNAVAPRNEWCAEGGSPARTRASATPVIAGPVEIAWKHVPEKGSVVGEPIVFQQWACIEEESPGRRALAFVRVHDGSLIGRVVLKGATEPLLPSQAGGTLVVRSAPMEWRTYVVLDGKVALDGKHKTATPIHDLVAVWDPTNGARVMLAETNALSLRAAVTGKSLWRRKGGRVQGRIAIRDRRVCFIEADEPTGVRVLDAWTGHFVSRQDLGYDPTRGESDFREARVSLFPTAVVVSNVRTEKRHYPGERLVYLIDILGGDFASGILGEVGLVHGAGTFAANGETWLAVLDEREKSGLRLCRAGADGRFSILSRSARDGMLSDALHPTLAVGTTLLGRFAAAGDELGIRWTAPVRGGARVVPARGRVLYAYPERVVAVRTKAREGRRTRLLAPPDGEFGGTLVTDQGVVVEGSFLIDTAAWSLTVSGGATLALDATSLVLDAAGGVVALGPAIEVEDALLTISQRRRGAALAKLAIDAARSRDLGLLALLVTYARALQAPSADLKRASTKLKGLGRMKSPRLVPKIAAQIRAQAEPLLQGDQATLADAYDRLPEGADSELRIDLLRLALASGGAIEAYRDDVRALIPESLRPSGEFDVRAWLEVAEAARTTQFEIVPAPTADTPELTPGERVLGALTHTWRKDLIAVRSKQLMVVAPLESPGSLGRCLSVGEVVCDLLEGVFSAGERDRSSRFPLTILVYPTEDSYRERTREKGARAHVSEYSVGHYAPSEELSHMYLPDDPDAFRAMMPTFAHELTHQWIAERCPLFSGAEDRGEGDVPGNWIIEGFAEMVEERTLDVRARSWTFDPRGKSLTAVATLGPQKLLIPWEQHMSIGYDVFAKLDHEFKYSVPGGSELASGGRLSETNVFYAQSAALCHYLFEAEGGALRPKLLDFVRLRYTGRPPDVKAHFGMTPAELGAKVEAWAQGLSLR